jgi:hypothetical protein
MLSGPGVIAGSSGFHIYEPPACKKGTNGVGLHSL